MNWSQVHVQRDRKVEEFSSAPNQPEGVGSAVMVACVKLFPRALMKRTQLIDGE